MVEDRSLDEFAPADSPEGNEGSAEGHGEPAEESDSSLTEPEPAAAVPDTPHDGVEPATSTSTWTSAGVACESCGEKSVRRWIDDGALVCSDCKTW